MGIVDIKIKDIYNFALNINLLCHSLFNQILATKIMRQQKHIFETYITYQPLFHVLKSKSKQNNENFDLIRMSNLFLQVHFHKNRSFLECYSFIMKLAKLMNSKRSLHKLLQGRSYQVNIA